LIKKSKISDLKQYQGKIDLDIDLDVLRDRGWYSCWHIRLDRLFQEWKIFRQVEPTHRFTSCCHQRFDSHRADPFFDDQEEVPKSYSYSMIFPVFRYKSSGKQLLRCKQNV